MFRFLETDIREQKKYEKSILSTPVDNAVNDLCYEINFENRVNNKNYFFIKWSIAFLFETKTYFILGDVFFFIPKNSIASAFF